MNGLEQIVTLTFFTAEQNVVHNQAGVSGAVADGSECTLVYGAELRKAVLDLVEDFTT